MLVVDDYPPNRLLLAQQLGLLGHRVVEAADGLSGLEAWHREHFDVVISNCSMPNMNGYEMASFAISITGIVLGMRRLLPRRQRMQRSREHAAHYSRRGAS
ncbi:response regulator receiver domain-containing protein [Pseudomonas sp. SJZ080]|uniref:response regulator n=1 Tax=Pseudomonas sp. SJZ080 TaxID=2572888 RepID=UPI00119B0250|nr:response regulator [Pseudomonas sp. SJZ080]TWC46126.1 response regulator receiver domain-containing protein [Pseudomonas sp. SJZ080]